MGLSLCDCVMLHVWPASFCAQQVSETHASRPGRSVEGALVLVLVHVLVLVRLCMPIASKPHFLHTETENSVCGTATSSQLCRGMCFGRT